MESRRRRRRRWWRKRRGGSLPPAHCPRGRRIDPEAAAVIRPLIKCQSPTHPLTRPKSPSRHPSCSRFTASLPVSRPPPPPPPPPPTSLLHSIRPLLAVRTRVSGEPPPLNHHARDRHIHRDIAISCVNYRPYLASSPPPVSLLSDPRGHHAHVVSSPVIVVCDAANLYYAAHRFTRASRFRAITRGRENARAISICWIISQSLCQNFQSR